MPRALDIEAETIDLKPLFRPTAQTQLAGHTIKLEKIPGARRKRALSAGRQDKRKRSDLRVIGDVVAELAVLDRIAAAIDAVGDQRDLAVVEGQDVLEALAAGGMGHGHIAHRHIGEAEVVDLGCISSAGREALDVHAAEAEADGGHLHHVGKLDPGRHGHVQGREVAGGKFLHIEVDARDLEPALVLQVQRAAVEPWDEHEVVHGLRARSDAPARIRARQGAAEVPLRHNAARAVRGKRLELDLTVAEGQRRAGFGERLGVVLHVRDRHVGEVEVVDLLARVVHADKRRTIQRRTRCRHRQQRRQAGIAVEGERERREGQFAGAGAAGCGADVG